MGLDMYLNKTVYIGANFGHNNVEGSINLTKQIGEKIIPIKVNLSRVSYIVETVAEWRKANHIHKWFVDNVQGGEDDCQEYSVDRYDLVNLLNVCKEVIRIAKLDEDGSVINDDEVADLLPTTEGFFFGSQTYDKGYMDDVKYTIMMLELALSEEGYHFTYRSSW